MLPCKPHFFTEVLKEETVKLLKLCFKRLFTLCRSLYKIVCKSCTRSGSHLAIVN